jgi:4-amino-4-deoxy-L-arabinose transferase-like glycosyltransferase
MHDRRIPRSFHLLLLGITLLSLVPRLILGASEYIEYDGYWHVWIAHQTQWGNFIPEYQANAHPPLYFLLLRLTFWLGHTNLTYRAISIATGVGSVWLVGIIAWRAVRSQVWAALAALAYGLALPAILISEEVRTYMMAAFLVQASFWYFLDLIEDPPGPLRSRVLFGVLATLACLTEYYALIYVGAVLLLALIVQPLRAKNGALRALGREVLTFGLLLALPAWEYISHFAGEPRAYAHLPGFYFAPDGAESAADFLLRNLRNEFNVFSPLQIPDGTLFWAVLAAAIVMGAAIFWLARRWSQARNIAAGAIVIVPLAIMGAIMFGGVARVYPFGGFLRQQYILFPFFAICPFLFFDRALARVPRPAILAIAGLFAVGIGYAGYENYEAYPKNSRRLLSDQMARYNRLFPAAPAIIIDQFNLTTFFLHHDQWKWSFVSALPGTDTVDVYKLEQNGRSMMLLRQKDRWNLDLRDPQLYAEMARGMQTWHLPSMTIFCLAQAAPKARTGAQVAAYRARAAELSANQGLCIQTLDLDNYDVYAEFRAAGACTASPSAP